MTAAADGAYGGFEAPGRITGRNQAANPEERQGGERRA